MRNDCETCVNYVYDEDCEESICTVNLDEDELVRFMEDSHYCCPYYRLDDEYAVVRMNSSRTHVRLGTRFWAAWLTFA